MAKVTNNSGSVFRGRYLLLKPGSSSEEMTAENALQYYGLDGLVIEFNADDNLDNISDGQKRLLTSRLGADFANELAIPQKSGLSRAKKVAKKTVGAILPEMSSTEPSEEEPEVESVE
jgi:hypothetical protein